MMGAGRGKQHNKQQQRRWQREQQQQRVLENNMTSTFYNGEGNGNYMITLSMSFVLNAMMVMMMMNVLIITMIVVMPNDGIRKKRIRQLQKQQ